MIEKDSGVLDLVGCVFRVSTAIPVRVSTMYPMLPVGGAIVFQPSSPGDPRQQVFGFAPEKINSETGEVTQTDDETPM
ncbi:MAG: hypothetical protein IT440_11070 [Phycisphaeraceae bacterium]|nr:hypothetical protein [Phycisphaeraceae bacterium]